MAIPGAWPVRHRDLDSASGEVLPQSPVTLLGSVHHAAVHGAVRLNSGRKTLISHSAAGTAQKAVTT
jgi:hypothetical protein